MAAVCSSQCGVGSIISVKALRASVYIDIQARVFSVPLRFLCVLTLSLFIWLDLCSGVTLSSPSHLNTLRQTSYVFTDIDDELPMSTYGPSLTLWPLL